MISSASQLRQKGADDLKGRWGEAALFTFVYIIILVALSSLGSVVPFFGSIIVGWLLLPMTWGFTMTFLANHRKEDNDPFNLSHLI